MRLARRREERGRALRGTLEDREEAVHGIEETRFERRRERRARRSLPRRLDGREVNRLQAEEDLGGDGATEPFVRP